MLYDVAVSEIETITSVANARVKRVVKWRKPRERRVAGVLIAEGFREVERALRAGLRCRELFVCEGLVGEGLDGVLRGLTSGNPRPTAGDLRAVAVLVNDAVLRKMAYHDKPEGVLGVFDVPAWSLDDIEIGVDALVLVVVGTEKPGNLGAMVRTAAAAGCVGVVAVRPAVDVFNPNAIRNSTGAVFALPTVVVERDEDALAWLEQKGLTVLAAVAPPEDGSGDDARREVRSCFEAAWSWPAAVVVGPEHAGLDERWRSAADVCVTIPMPGERGVDSLNASNAAAVLLYEAVRRRG